MVQLIHIIILYSDGEAVCKIIGRVIIIMIIYGEGELIHCQIIGGEIGIIQEKDNDHVQSDIMFLVHENGDF